MGLAFKYTCLELCQELKEVDRIEKLVIGSIKSAIVLFQM